MQGESRALQEDGCRMDKEVRYVVSTVFLQTPPRREEQKLSVTRSVIIPIRMLRLPVHRVTAHILQSLHRLPAKHALRLRRIRVTHGDVALATRTDLVRNLLPARLLLHITPSRLAHHRVEHLQHRIPVTRAQVEHLRPVLHLPEQVLHRLQVTLRTPVPSGVG